MENTNILKNFFSVADEAFCKNYQKSSFFFETTSLEDSVLLEMILPGYDRNEITIDADGENLTVETNNEFKESKWKSSFKRSFRVGDSLNIKNTKASLEKGILEISIPKKEKPKKVSIKIN